MKHTATICTPILVFFCGCGLYSDAPPYVPEEDTGNADLDKVVVVPPDMNMPDDMNTLVDMVDAKYERDMSGDSHDMDMQPVCMPVDVCPESTCGTTEDGVVASWSVSLASVRTANQ